MKVTTDAEKNITVFIADDDEDIVEALSLLLDDEGYTVYSISKGDITKEIVEKNPDIVLLDIWMSGIDGRVICKTVKTDQRTKDVPVILVSASRDIEKSAKESGADGYIEKPFEFDQIIRTIQKKVAPERNQISDIRR